MQIIVTVENNQNSESYDISVDPKQRISHAFKVIMTHLGHDRLYELERIQLDTGRWLDMEKTYVDEHIFSGAKLKAVYEKKR